MMPQSKIIYESIIYLCLLLILVAHLVLANPIALEDDMPQHNKRSRDKRSFNHIHCKGIYDKSIFAKVDQICEDCYNLFREQKLHTLCRQDCFTTPYFKGCVDVLLLSDELEKIQEWIRRLNGLGV